MRLKDKTKLAVSDGRHLVSIEMAYVFALQHHSSARGLVQSSNNMQKSALAGTGRAYNSQGLTGLNFQ